MARPKRIDGFSYVGLHRYFLTICARDRHSYFANARVAGITIEQFERAANTEGFSILAYCLMPDHAHWLTEGVTTAADFRQFVKRAKQQSGAAFALEHGGRLWQTGYYEHVLRTDQSSLEIARYIVGNPVRARMVANASDYPFSGSCKWTLKALLEGIQDGSR